MKFLQRNGLDLQAIDLNDLVKRFRASMQAGLSGKGPLPMLPSMAKIPKVIPSTGAFPAFDVGGTNTRSARVHFHPEGSPTLQNMCKGKMPGSNSPVSIETFYHQLCEVLQPNLNTKEALGYCFSYAFDEKNRLLHWTKGIQAPEVVGTDVVDGLKNALSKHGINDVKITILNDTVATLLAAYASSENKPYAGYVGFILGTGVNAAYAERSEAIVKAPFLPPHELCPINCESGNFTDFPRTTFDNRYEALTGNGKAQWERCISGVHLGPLCTELFRQAADEGLLSPQTADYVYAKTFTFVELNHFCIGNHPTLFNMTTDEERTLIRSWILAMVERAACFSAVNIVAAALASAEAQGATEGTILVNADGSTFWKTSCIPFAERVQHETNHLLQHYGFTLRCIYVEDSPLIGAALAATQA